MTRFTSTSGLAESTRTTAIRGHIEAQYPHGVSVAAPHAVGPLVFEQLYRASFLADCMEALGATGSTAATGEVPATASRGAQRLPPPVDATGTARVGRGASRSIQKRRRRR